MITLSITTTAQGSLLTDPNVGRRFDQEITATLQELGALGQNRVVAKTPNGVSSGGGGLRGSIFTELHGVPATRGQLISSSVYYAPFVERGRLAGKRPPSGPILLWVTRKLGKTGPEAQSVAFLVARKIGRSGTRAVKMFERTATEIAPIVRARFQALADRIEGILK